MIYIFVEDSTSGFDFISAIISRGLVPNKPYKLVSIQGCGNIHNVCYNILKGVSAVTHNDVFVFYIDNYTTNSIGLTCLMDLVAYGYSVFVVDYYCFESVLYSYNFEGNVVGDEKFKGAYDAMKLMLQGKYCLWYDFKNRFSELLGLKYNSTIEQAANLVFVRYYNRLGCILVNKSSYGYCLDDAARLKTIGKMYYNSGCRLFNRAYCESMYKHGFCKRVRRARNNLLKLYKYSVLSKPLVCLNNKGMSQPLHQLLGVCL